MTALARRTLLAAPLALPLAGCAAPFTPAPGAPDADADALLRESAAAHGAAALARMSDLSVSYAGAWRGLVGRLQPALVDEGFRGGSQERVLLRAGIVAQAHAGPDGRKQVVRRWGTQAPGEVSVWYDGRASEDADRRAAAALVADGYALFLLGPMLLDGLWRRERMLSARVAGTRRITTSGGAEAWCDVLRVRLAPGLGLAPADDLALDIDRGTRLMRRVRFSLEGLGSTQGAVAEVDCDEHVLLDGLRVPTRFHERLIRPAPLPVHDWRLTGFDADRGLRAEEVAGDAFAGAAVPPAGAVPFPAPARLL